MIMVLLVDNYDSFTYNLYGYLIQLRVDCKVVRNDVYSSEDIIKMDPQAIVFSPGPKKPQDAGIMMELIEKCHENIPILGICLGHQAIGTFFGAKLVTTKHPMHGKTSIIKHNNDPVFEGLPETIEVMRYHSLLLSDIDNKDLEVIAETSDNEIMAISHKKFPIYGFQFHPESILTEKGMVLLSNWVNINRLIKKKLTDLEK